MESVQNTGTNEDCPLWEEEDSPSDITLDQHIFDLCFHPSQDLVATGLISGEVKLFRYSLERNDQLSHWKLHHAACRTVDFSCDGKYLLSGSSDCSVRVIDVDTCKEVHCESSAHENPINAMKCFGENLLLTGDDEGCIKLWDLRKRKFCFQWKESADFISDFAVNTDKKIGLATSGDGCLSVLHLRKGILEAMSDNLEDELLSVVIAKNGTKVIVGTQDGILDIWNWDWWGDITDRFLGHPNSIESMVVIDEDTICTASSDGLIRICSILPNKMLGIIGEHGEFPVEKIRLSRENYFLGSCSHDNTVKFWAVKYLFEENKNNDNTESAIAASDCKGNLEDNNIETMDIDSSGFSSTNSVSNTSKKSKQKKKSRKEEKSNFFDGLL